MSEVLSRKCEHNIILMRACAQCGRLGAPSHAKEKYLQMPKSAGHLYQAHLNQMIAKIIEDNRTHGPQAAVFATLDYNGEIYFTRSGDPETCADLANILSEELSKRVPDATRLN